MKTYDASKDFLRIRKYFELTQEELANNLEINRVSLARYENGTSFPEQKILDSLFSYAIENGLNLNEAKSIFFNEDKGEKVLLFHGAKGDIKTDIDTKHSILPNDFGEGFYAGEKYEQASTWISEEKNGSVYAFYFKPDKDFKKKEFKVNKEWMYAILYYRGAFKNFKVPLFIETLIKEIEECDYLIAPIADNQMYQILNRFANNEITDVQCYHALSMTNLGLQYVFKSERACQKLECLDRLFICKEEKKQLSKLKMELSKSSQTKADLAIVEYRRKGQYFDEIFKRI